jgi:hypothetical protein
MVFFFVFVIYMIRQYVIWSLLVKPGSNTTLVYVQDRADSFIKAEVLGEVSGE